MQDYITGRGRVGRLHHFLFSIGIWIPAFLVVAVTAETDPLTQQTQVHALGWLFLLAAIWLGLTNNIRRAHDFGKSGWWLLLTGIPLIGIIFVFQLYFESGTPGTNTYGPAPGSDMSNPKAMEMRMEKVYAEAEAANGPASDYYNEDGSFNMDGLFENPGNRAA